MSVANFRYSVFNPEEIKSFDENKTAGPTDSIVTVTEGTTKRVDATCYEVEPQRSTEVLGTFEYQVSNVSGEHRITEIRFERGKDVPFREQLAAFHFARTWYMNHDDKHEKSDDKYEAFVAGYKIIYTYDDTSNDDKQSTSNNARPVTGVKKSTQCTDSAFEVWSTASDFHRQRPFIGGFFNKVKSLFSADTDHTQHRATSLKESDGMIQSGLKDYNLSNESSVLIAAGETLTLAEVKNGMKSVVDKLRQANPNKTTLFPIGVSERGTFFSGHTVLCVVTPTNTFIIDSDSLNFYGNIQCIKSGFQGLRDTSNCGRYAAYTCIELAKQIDDYLGAENKKTVDEMYIENALACIPQPSLETLKTLSLQANGVKTEHEQTNEEWEQIDMPSALTTESNVLPFHVYLQ